MRQITVFVPTGEVRKAKQGEWYLTDAGYIFQWNDRGESYAETTIMTRHVIEISEGAANFYYHVGLSGDLKTISIPQLEKRYRWRYKFHRHLPSLITEQKCTITEVQQLIEGTWEPIDEELQNSEGT